MVLGLANLDRGAAILFVVIHRQHMSTRTPTVYLASAHVKEETNLGDQDAVASSAAHGHALAVLVQAAGADGENLGLVELLDARLGEEDAAGRLGLGLDALHEHAVEERDK